MLSVTMLVTAWKRTSYLERCLASLDAQRDMTDEVIVTEDGFDPDVQHEIERVAYMHKAMYHRVEGERARCRLNRAMNEGINLATADILVITSQDLVFPPDFLSSVRARMDNLRPRKVLLIPYIETLERGEHGPGSDGTVPNRPEGEDDNHWGADRPCIITWRTDAVPFDEEFDNWRGSGTLEWAFRMVRVEGAKVVTDHSIRCAHVNHGDIAWEQKLVPAGIFLYCQLTGENYAAAWNKAG